MLINRRYAYKITPIVPSVFACDGDLNVNNNGAGIYILDISVGSQTGTVSVVIDSLSIPDRFQIEYNENIVADSLYVGDGIISDPPNYAGMVGTTYNNIPEKVYDLTLGDFVDTGVIQTVTIQQSDFQPTAAESGGLRVVSFEKTTATPNKIRLIATSVFSGTSWGLKTYCITGYKPVILAQGSTNVQACNNYDNAFLSDQYIYFIPENEEFPNVTSLYTDAEGTTPASVTFYSDGTQWMKWGGTNVVSTGTC